MARMTVRVTWLARLLGCALVMAACTPTNEPAKDVPDNPAEQAEPKTEDLPELQVVSDTETIVPLNGGKPQSGLDMATLKIGQIEVEVELAKTPRQREIGLMYRTSLPPNHGMLFIYPEKGQRNFWMKNTNVPLSLAYIRDDGHIVEVIHMEPSSAEVPPSYPSSENVRYCLEMVKGWFKERGLKAGDKVTGHEGLQAKN